MITCRTSCARRRRGSRPSPSCSRACRGSCWPRRGRTSRARGSGCASRPSPAGMIESAGLAVAEQDDLDDLLRGRPRARTPPCTFGLSSSRWFVFFGFELMMKSFWSTPGTSVTSKPAFFSVSIPVARHGLDRVDLVRLERRDERVVVREHPQPERVDLRLRPVEGRVALEERDLVLRELRQLERARRRRSAPGSRRSSGRCPCCLCAGSRCASAGSGLLELREHVPDRRFVLDTRVVGFGAWAPLMCAIRPGHVRGAGVLVLDVGVDRPGRVLGGHRLAVRPLRVRLGLERPGLAAVGRLPRGGEIGHELRVLPVVLDQRSGRCT